MVKERFKITPYSAIILRKDQKVLLIKRATNLVSGGFYAFPGGGVDGQESITSATVREAYEEIGIKVLQENLRFVNVLHVKTDLNHEFLNFFFEVTQWEKEPQNKEPDKCDGFSWFDLNNLPDTILPSHKYVLEMMAQGIYFGEFGWKK
ncbi:NUDIX domain-containing protein [bacterium]|nr:NUDIX domain-containing protein [bacterium]